MQWRRPDVCFSGWLSARLDDVLPFNIYNMKTDKLLHVLCGYIIALTVGIWLPWLGALVGVAAAFGKEFLWDRLLKRGTFEWADINATLVGVLTGFSIAFLRASIA